ncbi:MAG TPA: serine/threonine-protein kinase [Polyangiaceae bacterium]
MPSTRLSASTNAISTLVRVPVLDAGVTLSDALASTVAPVSPARAPAIPLDDPGFASRYGLGDPLGEGGMGVVRLALDQRVGREIAIKTIRRSARSEDREDLVVRFLREACIQGQLEHPAVVPVYDLGRDPDGALYFTMRRIRGATFEEIIERLRAGDTEAAKHYSRRKLLTAFASVCQAVHFAHTRGVVHRDLKPANVMLGDFGEVYVLDWGVAKLVSTPDLPARDRPSISPDTHGATHTLDGSTMGTPGYMAPEQVRASREIDHRADVYALGAILFELATLQPLHSEPNAEGKFIATLQGANARASARSPHLEIAPELDAMCMRATALDAADRFQSVGDLIEALERHLDGDRDLERRRLFADDLARAAKRAADEALGEASDPTEARRRALSDVGRALALDPHNERAMRTLVRLLTEPPRTLPEEALAEMRASSQSTSHATSQGVMFGYLAWFLLMPFELWMGVRSAPMVLLTALLWATAAVGAFVALRRSDRGRGWAFGGILATALAACSTSAVCGPFVLVPTLAVINVTLWILVSDPSLRRMIVALGALTILVPAVLEWTRVLRFYNFRDGRVTMLQGMLDFPPVPTHAFLAAATMALVGIAAAVTSRFRDSLTDAERRLHMQTWQLKQLVRLESAASSRAHEAQDA